MSLGDDTPGSRAAPSRAVQHAGLPEPPFTKFGSFRLFPAERRLAREGKTVPLEGRALDILVLLVGNAGNVVTKQELMAQVWRGVSVDESGLRAQISFLRRALGDGKGGVRYITNVAGQGYCFVHPVTDGADPGTPRHLGSEYPEGQYGSRLPRRSTPIINRDEDREAIRQLLKHHRFITIHGSGGIGKTTVVLAVRTANGPRHPGEDRH